MEEVPAEGGEPAMLVVEANLELTTPTGPIQITGDHQDVIVQVTELRTGLDLLRIVNDSMGGRKGVETVDELLRNFGVGLRIRVHGAEVAHLGAGAQPGVVTRLLHSAILR
jgi:hypothetical protein